MTEISFRPAERRDVSLLIGLAGPSGGGKTLSALKLARGLAGDKPFGYIDTESGRALMYADVCAPWEHADLSAPYSPERYGEAITAADKAGYPVIVVDSFSHEHAGDGGLLDQHGLELDRMAGDNWKKREAVTFAAWVKPKASHKKLIYRLLQLRAHLIICLRAEPKVELVKENGKTKVIPKRTLTSIDGWIPIAEKNLAFELSLSLLVTPDAPGHPKPVKLPEQFRAFMPLDKPITEETGERLARWAAGKGPSAQARRPEGVEKLTADLLELADQLGKHADTEAAIEKQRHNAPDSGAHAAWLQRQIERMRAEVTKAKDAGQLAIANGGERS